MWNGDMYSTSRIESVYLTKRETGWEGRNGEKIGMSCGSGGFSFYKHKGNFKICLYF